VYPTTKTDEFYYGVDGKLLEDHGNQCLDSSCSSHVLDEYVWLGGRPIAVLKSLYDANWERQLDNGTQNCSRNGEDVVGYGEDTTKCGAYKIVTDYLGKPILTLNDAGLIAGASLEEDPFGLPNHRELKGDSAHPYTGDATATLAGISLPSEGTSSSLEKGLRFNFAMVDTDCAGNTVDYVKFTANDTVDLAPNHHVGGPFSITRWGPWTDISAYSGGTFQAKFVTNGVNKTLLKMFLGWSCRALVSSDPYDGIARVRLLFPTEFS